LGACFLTAHKRAGAAQRPGVPVALNNRRRTPSGSRATCNGPTRSTRCWSRTRGQSRSSSGSSSLRQRGSQSRPGTPEGTCRAGHPRPASRSECHSPGTRNPPCNRFWGWRCHCLLKTASSRSSHSSRRAT
jgi:hypothetical protein